METKAQKKRGWHQSRVVLWLMVLLIPPVGLVLLWLRSTPGFFGKLLGSVAVAGVAVVHLFLFYGLQVEVGGSGFMPVFTFQNTADHYKELERHRAEQRRRTREQEPAAARPAATGRASSYGRYWTRFRGPNMDGIYEEREILTRWPPGGLSLLWKQPVGGGYGSFAVADGRAFTLEQRRRKETLAAYDLETGRELWADSWGDWFQENMGGDGPRSTPTWDEGRVYALGAGGELRVVVAETGELIWRRNILRDNGAGNLQWGMAASPLIVEDKVIVLPGGSRGRSVVAYDKLSGEVVWQALDDPQAYTSPMLVTLSGVRQLLVVSANRAMGLEVEDGSLLWDYPWVTEYGVNAAQPLVLGSNRFFISAGYGHGAAVVEVTRQGQGEPFTLRARPVWENNRMKNRFSSSVVLEGHVYGLDEGILAAVDLGTGERKWKGGRYGHGELLLASGHLIVLSERGQLVLVKATPESHQELASFPALQGKTWNHPALADGVLLVRNAREMAAFRVAAVSSAGLSQPFAQP